jgi:uncharacterized damage-inducible protein DinB
MILIELQYPIGKFVKPEHIPEVLIHEWIKEIEKLPEQLIAAVDGLSEEQMDTVYRPGGWTITQVVHHIADSHINAYSRFHLALTEENPTIKPYQEAHWAELEDGKNAPVEFSLNLLTSLHQRWVYLLKSMTEEQYKRIFFHPGTNKVSSLNEVLGLYAWHGKHHLAHITELKKRNKW